MSTKHFACKVSEVPDSAAKIVKIQQFHDDIAERLCAAKEDVVFVPLIVWQSKRRVLEEIDIPLNQLTFATGALTLFAAVRHGNALTESCIKYRFAFLDFHFYAHWFKANRVHYFIRHSIETPPSCSKVHGLGAR